MIASDWPPIIMNLCVSIEIVSHLLMSNFACLLVRVKKQTMDTLCWTLEVFIKAQTGIWVDWAYVYIEVIGKVRKM
jgi:hypothetical protein